MSEESEEIKSARLIGELHGRMGEFFTRYENDRRETTRRYTDEQMERRQWRDEIHGKVSDLEKKINPVVKDHQLIIAGGKWIAGLAVSGFGVLKAWVFVKDHLK